MARVKLCPACGHANPPVEIYCSGAGAAAGCGAPLTDVRVTTLDEGGSQGAGAGPSADRTVVEPSTFALVFPWGAIPLGDGLAVGRDPLYSPLAAQLAQFDTVSRRHAEVRLQGDGLVICQVGATNPTYVNGMALLAGESITIQEGDEIAFSGSLKALVRSLRSEDADDA